MSRAADLGYAAGWRVVRLLPERLAVAGFNAAADWTTRRRGRGVQRLARNLRQVVGPDMPEPRFEALLRRAVRSYHRYAMEAFRLPNRTREQHLRGFRLNQDSFDMFTAQMASHPGAIIALPHAGNWDAAGAWVTSMGWPLVTVAERLRPESLYRRFVAYREGLGMEILPLTGGQGSTIDLLEERLRRGYVVPILADRDLPGRGVEVDFFGARTTVPAGPAVLALRTGAPLYTLDIWYSPETVRGRLRGPLPLPDRDSGPLDVRVRELAQRVADGLGAGIAEHPEDWHMMQRMWPDDTGRAVPAGDAGPRRAPAPGTAPSGGGTRHGPARPVGGGVRIGIVCPYSFDTPGGVQNHVHDLAEALIGLGHSVSVLAPAEDDESLPEWVVPGGRAVPVRYNGSVARLAFGPISAARVRRWLAAGRFDVVHVHEPISPSLAMLAVLYSRAPVVATFHTAMTRSRAIAAAQGLLQLVLEKITARIAVSDLARRVQVEHLGGGAWEIPNGVAVARYAGAQPLPGWPGDGGTIGFLGRFTEPRKGFGVLLDAYRRIAADRPGVRLLVAGPGDPAELDPPAPRGVTFLGKVSEADKARMLRSIDLYVAPNTRGESFGMILTEAMAAGAPVIASDLDAFRRVLDGGRAGELFPVGDGAALAGTVARLLDDPARRADLREAAGRVVAAFDWPIVARRVLEVYATAIEASRGVVVDLDDPPRAGSLD